ncbi:hypothetical protein QFC21_002723 [Naganishia friedmannii]|uniref:Uncharacterized protein n=1 Tax=Naganishia friedmannii TaxID=89922 RepID=A0ACC2VSB6_9TREE|nr:hypothetical protein QFC21_002723 [Naganishia friedmannii]
MTLDIAIEEVIRKSEAKTKALATNLDGLGLEGLTNFRTRLNTKIWEGHDYTDHKHLPAPAIEPSKRPRGKLDYLDV